MAEVQPKFHQSPPSKISKPFLGIQICLRFLVICTALAATWLMISAKQTTEILGISLDARYTYSSAFKFLAIANAVACAFSLVSLCLLLVMCHRFANPANFFFFFIHDLLLMCLVLAGCGCATAIGMVGKYGNDHTGWSPICDHFGKFCERVMASLVLSYLSFFLLLTLTLLSAGKCRQIQA